MSMAFETAVLIAQQIDDDERLGLIAFDAVVDAVQEFYIKGEIDYDALLARLYKKLSHRAKRTWELQ